MGAFGGLPHGRWVREHNPGLGATPGRRSTLAGSVILAGSLALLLWRAASEIASGSDLRAVAVGTPVPGVSANDRRYALIVSVPRYDDPSLPSLDGRGRGAEQLHDALTTHAGFAPANVRRVDGSGPHVMNPTRGNVLRALHELLERIPRDGNAMLLVSFTGQGSVARGKAYLLPQDAIAAQGDDLMASTAIDFDADIRHRVLERGVRQVVLLVDSTATGRTAPARALDAGFVTALALEARPPQEAVAVVHATAPGSVSYADPGSGAVFTQAVVDGILGAAPRAADGWITLGALLRYVQESVPGRAGALDPRFRQEPQVVVHGVLPDEIRFARVAPQVASSTGELRCALRAPGAATEGLHVFDVAANGDSKTIAVQAVQVVNGNLVGTPFGQPVPLTSPREWPIRRASAGSPLLAVAHTSVGKCAAFVAAAPARPPVYGIRWQAANAEGVPYREVFRHATENRQGRTDVIAAATDHLRDSEGRITGVEYSCEGATCAWSRHPDGAGYAGDITIGKNAFSWRRRWEGDPAVDTYTAYYEMPVRVCVEGCP